MQHETKLGLLTGGVVVAGAMMMIVAPSAQALYPAGAFFKKPEDF